MFFELEDKTYRIKFYRTGKTTVAELFEVLNERAEKDGSPYASLGVYGLGRPRHDEKRFVKSLGRKAALANLLKQLSDPEIQVLPLSKAEREMIWVKYFEMHRK